MPVCLPDSCADLTEEGKGQSMTEPGSTPDYLGEQSQESIPEARGSQRRADVELGLEGEYSFSKHSKGCGGNRQNSKQQGWLE